MAIILAANSIVGRKGLNLSFVVGKQMKDQVERVGMEVASQEATGRPPLLDKEKNKVEEVPKKKHHFSATELDGSAASSPPP